VLRDVADHGGGDCRGRIECVVLRQPADGDSAGVRDATRVDRLVPRDDREQGRLAAAVATYDADVVTVENAE
jgi:hypothetical protein